MTLLACGPDAAKTIDGDEGAIVLLPRRAHADGQPATGVVTYSASREAVTPLSLRDVTLVDAAAQTEQVVTLPVPVSTQGVWARVTLPERGWLEVDGRKQQLDGAALVFFPLQDRALHFTVEKAQSVELAPVAAVDSVGGGFDVKQEPTVTVTLVTGATRIADAAHTPGVADDSFSRLARLELRSDAAAQVLLGRCGPNDAPVTIDRAFNVAAGAPTTVTELLPAGELCAQSDAEVSLKLDVAGRVRRFAQTSLRPVQPLTVLDTSTGVGRWLGEPQPGQRLDFDLASLTGLDAASQVLVRVDAAAPVTFGPCASERATHAPGALVLVPSNASLCLETSTQSHARVTLLAAVTPRSEDTGVCRAPTTLPACNETTLVGRLNCLPGVTAQQVQMTPLPQGTTQYFLRVEQPVDHFRPDSATFQQRVLLTVRDEAAPMVLMTTGYELFGYFSELTTEFDTNQLEVEHRFFNESTPQPLDYSTLTIMQSAYDSHRIVELLKPLFTAPWVSTGTSKGGMTALYHRRFFPCDVDASVPYVTPLSLGKQDARYGPWLAQLGGPMWENCRLTFEELEIGVISRRAELAPTLRGTYTRIGGAENALWASTGSALWGMFQSGQQADPDRGCPAWEPVRGDPQFDEIVAYYAGSGESYADEYIAQGELDAYSYQTQNELGAPGGNRAHLAQFGPVPVFPDIYELLFVDVPLPDFEARAMVDVQAWLKAHGERFLFLYGGFDPWTGGRVDIEGARDSLSYVVAGGSHGVDLVNLPTAQRDEAFSRLEAWLGVRRAPKRGKAAGGEPLPVYRDFMHRHRL